MAKSYRVAEAIPAKRVGLLSWGESTQEFTIVIFTQMIINTVMVLLFMAHRMSPKQKQDKTCSAGQGRIWRAMGAKFKPPPCKLKNSFHLSDLSSHLSEAPLNFRDIIGKEANYIFVINNQFM